jgi:hypothetical protein
MTEKINLSDAQYALDIVKAICSQVGPGIPASPQERQRAEMIKTELENHLSAGNVVMEEFTLAPGAFLGTYPVVILMTLAVILNVSVGRFSGVTPWITTIIALLFSMIAPLSFVLEFLLCREVIDPLYPKKQSINVIGTLRKPGANDVKRLLILSGHHDSAPENTWFRYIGYGLYPLSATYFIAMALLVVMSIIQLVGLVIGNEAVVNAGTLSWVMLVFPLAPALVFALFLTRGKKGGGIVPGAADNLSACGTVVAMCRFLVRNPSNIPEDTEIRFITFGSEEAGLRGSMRYVERHLDELKRLDTHVLNYEIVAYPEISIIVSDVNRTVRNSSEIINRIVAAAQRANVPYKLGPSGTGAGVDAVPFNRKGLKGATLRAFKVPQQVIAFYHQDRDTPDVLTLEPLLNVLKLTLEWVRNTGE